MTNCATCNLKMVLIQSTTLDITCDTKTADISLTKNWNFYNLNTVLLKCHISEPMLHWIWLLFFFYAKSMNISLSCISHSFSYFDTFTYQNLKEVLRKTSRFFIEKLDLKYILSLYMCFHSFQFSCINNVTISEKKNKYLAGRSLNR